MNQLYENIREIPQRATRCLAANTGIKLPRGVPYIGMGASYNAALTLSFSGVDIRPYPASEYFDYVNVPNSETGVLISQSGESSETIWNMQRFNSVIAITDNPQSTIGSSAKTKQIVQLYSGEEYFSATKSYINTLVALYCGLGFNPAPAISEVATQFDKLEELAKETALKIQQYMQNRTMKGFSILGSGPNYGTACQGALTFSEITRYTWTGISVAEYDHGFKETATDSIVIMLNGDKAASSRLSALAEVLTSKSNTLLIPLQTSVEAPLSPIPLIVQLNLILSYLADKMQIDGNYHLGEKVTKVDRNIS